MWAEALPLISNALGAVGAACFACNEETSGIEWAYISGPLSNRTPEYIEYYAPLDIYRPLVSAPPQPGWQTLSEVVPQTTLAQSEWYQDFILPSGLTDAVSIQPYQSGPRRILFGVHYETTQPTPASQDARFQLLLRYLQEAARIGQVQRTLNLKASLGTWTLDHLTDALFVTYDDGRVIEMNAAAEPILSRGKALSIRHGKLVATDAVEAEQLSALIANAAKTGNISSSASRILVGRADQNDCQLVTAFPLQGQFLLNERSTVVIRVVDLLNQPSSLAADLGVLFGLSPAEDRLAQALIQGRTLQQLTADFGVQMPTLRAQMRSVLRKCGVQRQVDLMRVLLRTY